MNNFKISFLNDVSFEQFKSFLDSLDEERKSWSLDLQDLKDDKEYYNLMSTYTTGAIVCLCNGNLIALTATVDFNEFVEISFVVKKEFQSRGVGTKMLLEMEKIILDNERRVILAKHFKDNIASHKAFLKAGYKVANIEEPIGHYKNVDKYEWKIKELQ